MKNFLFCCLLVFCNIAHSAIVGWVITDGGIIELTDERCDSTSYVSIAKFRKHEVKGCYNLEEDNKLLFIMDETGKSHYYKNPDIEWNLTDND